MGLFSDDDDQFNDAALVKAARKRIMAELEAKQAAHQQSVINNYGGGGGGSSGGGLMERMNGASGDDGDLRDYLVDIERRDLPEINEKTGKSIGWTKRVHRFTQQKKK